MGRSKRTYLRKFKAFFLSLTSIVIFVSGFYYKSLYFLQQDDLLISVSKFKSVKQSARDDFIGGARIDDEPYRRISTQQLNILSDVDLQVHTRFRKQAHLQRELVWPSPMPGARSMAKTLFAHRVTNMTNVLSTAMWHTNKPPNKQLVKSVLLPKRQHIPSSLTCSAVIEEVNELLLEKEETDILGHMHYVLDIADHFWLYPTNSTSNDSSAAAHDTMGSGNLAHKCKNSDIFETQIHAGHVVHVDVHDIDLWFHYMHPRVRQPYILLTTSSTNFNSRLSLHEQTKRRLRRDYNNNNDVAIKRWNVNRTLKYTKRKKRSKAEIIASLEEKRKKFMDMIPAEHVLGKGANYIGLPEFDSGNEEYVKKYEFISASLTKDGHALRTRSEDKTLLEWAKVDGAHEEKKWGAAERILYSVEPDLQMWLTTVPIADDVLRGIRSIYRLKFIAPVHVFAIDEGKGTYFNVPLFYQHVWLMQQHILHMHAPILMKQTTLAIKSRQVYLKKSKRLGDKYLNKCIGDPRCRFDDYNSGKYANRQSMQTDWKTLTTQHSIFDILHDNGVSWHWNPDVDKYYNASGTRVLQPPPDYHIHPDNSKSSILRMGNPSLKLFDRYPFPSYGSHEAVRDHYWGKNRYPQCAHFTIDAVRAGHIIFVQTRWNNRFFASYHNLIQQPYIIISTGDDVLVPHPKPIRKYVHSIALGPGTVKRQCEPYVYNKPYVKLIEAVRNTSFQKCVGVTEQPNKLVSWFASNMQMNRHDRNIFDIPGGINYGNITGLELFDVVLSALKTKKKAMIYSSFGIHVHYRVDAAQQMRRHGFAVGGWSITTKTTGTGDIAGIGSFVDGLLRMSEHVYTSSPEGYGIDCSRFWESLVVGNVPVIRNNPLSPYYELFPTVILNRFTAYKVCSRRFLNEAWAIFDKDKKFLNESTDVFLQDGENYDSTKDQEYKDYYDNYDSTHDDNGIVVDVTDKMSIVNVRLAHHARLKEEWEQKQQQMCPCNKWEGRKKEKCEKEDVCDGFSGASDDISMKDESNNDATSDDTNNNDMSNDGTSNDNDDTISSFKDARSKDRQLLQRFDGLKTDTTAVKAKVYPMHKIYMPSHYDRLLALQRRMLAAVAPRLVRGQLHLPLHLQREMSQKERTRLQKLPIDEVVSEYPHVHSYSPDRSFAVEYMNYKDNVLLNNKTECWIATQPVMDDKEEDDEDLEDKDDA